MVHIKQKFKRAKKIHENEKYLYPFFRLVMILHGVEKHVYHNNRRALDHGTKTEQKEPTQ